MYARSARQYHAAEIEADFAVHLVGTLIGAIGATVLLTVAVASANTAVQWSVVAYSVGLMAMPGSPPHITFSSRPSGASSFAGSIMQRSS